MKKLLIIIVVLIVGLLVLNKDIIINKYKLYRVSYDNKHTYDTVFNEYINNQYGLTFNKFRIKYLGVGLSSAILSSEKKDNFCMIYDIYPPFMQKEFRVTIGYDTLKILTDNFYEVLSTDPKFQHLYSEWVKKQVGIEDEGVELGFTGNFDKPYIDFDKITSLSKDYREVFENTHNLYAWMCEVKNIKELNENNVLVYAQTIRENYLLKAISKTGMPSSSKYCGRLYLSKTNNAREKGISYIIDFDIIDKNDSISELKYAILR